MSEPFFHEIVNIRTKSELYNRWKHYILSIDKSDLDEMINKGLTHQVDALKSMIKEIIAGQPIHRNLLKKLQVLDEKVSISANTLR